MSAPVRSVRTPCCTSAATATVRAMKASLPDETT